MSSSSEHHVLEGEETVRASRTSVNIKRAAVAIFALGAITVATIIVSQQGAQNGHVGTQIAPPSGFAVTSGFVKDGSVSKNILVAVKQNNLNQLEQKFWEVSDPNNANYGKFLTQDQVGQMTQNVAGTDAVTAFLTNAGFNVKIHKFGTFVEAVASLATVEKVFGCQFNQYTHIASGSNFMRAGHFTTPAEIGAHVSMVAHISDFPSIDVKPMVSLTPLATTDAPVTPAQLWTTYAISQHSGTAGNMSVFEGLGQSYNPTDLSEWENYFNVPSQPVSTVIGPNSPSACATSSNNCAEASLDVQYIIGVANQIPLTFWSIASSDNTPFYDWIVAVSNTAYPPLVHSMSYGGQENGNSKSLMDSTNTEFMKMGVRGLTIMISSGDDGAAGSGARGNSANCGFNPSWPATSPYILAVGATQFQGGSATGAQIPCQSNNVPASLITTGGGFSSVFAAPSYQTSAISAYLSSGVAIPNQVSQATAFTYPAPGFWAGGRGYPDVAALGHNYQVAINGYLYVLDGTSASAPVTAGMIALLNNKRLNAGQAPMGFINPFLYNLATTNPGVFHDATTGNNGCTASTTCCTGFNAAAGWDPVNGLGAFDFSKLITHV